MGSKKTVSALDEDFWADPAYNTDRPGTRVERVRSDEADEKPPRDPLFRFDMLNADDTDYLESINDDTETYSDPPDPADSACREYDDYER